VKQAVILACCGTAFRLPLPGACCGLPLFVGVYCQSTSTYVFETVDIENNILRRMEIVVYMYAGDPNRGETDKNAMSKLNCI
jgi:hypothetical protein